MSRRPTLFTCVAAVVATLLGACGSDSAGSSSSNSPLTTSATTSSPPSTRVIESASDEKMPITNATQMLEWGLNTIIVGTVESVGPPFEYSHPANSPPTPVTYTPITVRAEQSILGRVKPGESLTVGMFGGLTPGTDTFIAPLGAAFPEVGRRVVLIARYAPTLRPAVGDYQYMEYLYLEPDGTLTFDGDTEDSVFQWVRTLDELETQVREAVGPTDPPLEYPPPTT